eukprot:m.556611 g.556611  ORF g.556611 m.556611 type:complete len:58 (-) comp22184_c0_seq73:2581-2754(-)
MGYRDTYTHLHLFDEGLLVVVAVPSLAIPPRNIDFPIQRLLKTAATEFAIPCRQQST